MSQPPHGDDATKLGELSAELPAIDLDHVTAQRIAHQARQNLGKPPSRRRWILPIVAAIITASYGTYTILKLLEVLG